MAKEEIARFQKLSAAEASYSICMWERVNYRVICAENEYLGNRKMVAIDRVLLNKE